MIVHWRFRSDFDKGVATAIFLLVFLPKEISIDIPGALPQLTCHRVVLLVMLANVWPIINARSLFSISRLLWFLAIIAVSRTASTLVTALDTAASLKVLFGYLIEVVLFFVVVTAGLHSRRTIEMVVWNVVTASVCVAALGFIEKYTGLNLFAMVIPDMIDSEIEVTVTYRHRILLGYAMAMAFPLALVLPTPLGSWVRRKLPLMGAVSLPAVCYFANSRGPWVGTALAGAFMGAFTGSRIRRKLSMFALAAVLLLAARPGVLSTVTNLWEQSFSKQTAKGRSTEYRRILWTVVYGELTKSPLTMLFGYGGHSTEMLDLSHYFEKGAGGLTENRGFTSWDSQLASNCMQYGYLGFGLEVLLYLSIFHMLYRTWRNSAGMPHDRELAAACGAIALVYFWAMATVAIFNPQLEFLFWTVIAVAARLYEFPMDGESTEWISTNQQPDVSIPNHHASNFVAL